MRRTLPSLALLALASCGADIGPAATEIATLSADGATLTFDGNHYSREP